MADWPTDKELEEIYRKGSEKHNFEYDPIAWDQMQVLLDKKDNRKTIFFILFGLLFLSSTAMYFGFQNSYGAIKHSNKGTSAAQVLIDSNESLENSEATKQSLSLSSNTISNSADKTDSVIETKGAFNNSIDNKVGRTSEFSQNKFNHKTLPSSIKSNTSESKSSPPSGSMNKSQSLSSSSISINVIGNSELNSNNADYLMYQTLPTIGILPFLTDSYLNLPEPEMATATYDEKMEKNKGPIMLVATIGSESSWTPTGEFSSIDFSLGLGLRGRLNDKLGYTIGASYIRDLYIANQGDYKASQEFWKQTEEPNYTSANCKMLEINTGISYYLNGWSHNGVGIHLDILSNFMLNEQYNYHFEEESMDFSSSWTRSNTTWLNAINISPVYRFGYSKKGNIEVGPYFKIPLSGIGHGDIMLSSFGLKGSIRFF